MKIEHDKVCQECPKLDISFQCTVYSQEGMDFRIRQGYCPIEDRFAKWRKDVEVKLIKDRIGQKKGKKRIKK